MKKILIALLLLISTNVVNHVYAQVRSDLRQRIGEVRKNNIDSQSPLNELRLDESQKERFRTISSMFDVLISGLRKEVKRMKLEIELEKLNVIDLLVITNLLSSKSEVRRAIKNKGIKINNETVEDEKLNLSIDKFDDKNILKISHGKKRHVLLKLV